MPEADHCVAKADQRCWRFVSGSMLRSVSLHNAATIAGIDHVVICRCLDNGVGTPDETEKKQRMKSKMLVWLRLLVIVESNTTRVDERTEMRRRNRCFRAEISKDFHGSQAKRKI